MVRVENFTEDYAKIIVYTLMYIPIPVPLGTRKKERKKERGDRAYIQKYILFIYQVGNEIFFWGNTTSSVGKVFIG